MSAIFKREFSAYFNSAIGYIVLAVFYFFSGLYFYVYCLRYDSASISNVVASMFMILLFLIPLITMRSFSEEKKQKTDQALLTAPVNLFEVVFGKFLAAFALLGICVAIFLVYTGIIAIFATPDLAVTICTLLGIMLLGGALISIDIFISSLTESQIIAAIVSIGSGLLIYMLDSISSVVSNDFFSSIVNAISFNQNYTNFTLGILNLKNIIFFISVIAIFTFLTIRVIEKKRWS